MAISELSNTQHQAIKINPNAGVEYAKTQHLVNLRANEVAKAACDLPIFLARNAHNGSYTISGLTSFSAQQSLFVSNNQWQALYTPVCMQTQPLYLLTRETNSSEYFIAIDEQSSAVNTQQGEPLFDAKGNPSLYLSAQQKLLESDLKNSRKSRKSRWLRTWEMNAWERSILSRAIRIGEWLNLMMVRMADFAPNRAGSYWARKSRYASLKVTNGRCAGNMIGRIDW